LILAAVTSALVAFVDEISNVPAVADTLTSKSSTPTISMVHSLPTPTIPEIFIPAPLVVSTTSGVIVVFVLTHGTLTTAWLAEFSWIPYVLPATAVTLLAATD
jgi:hypothetical protein